MSPDLISRTRKHHEDETEDLALLFMEEEVGRFDWQVNWPKVKERENPVQKVQEWLTRIGSDHDPKSIVDFLDGMVATRAGKWR